MVRIADGAGIALDTATGLMSEDFRQELGLDEFESAGRTRESGPFRRAIAPVVLGAVRFGLRALGRRVRGRAVN